ncbi:MAG TPA: nuclear transport factor 2 family protein [Solirubrobacterales bacterium]|nr:nuclear transport factor 2 family protein [Solirubrobacterales bacterium]
MVDAPPGPDPVRGLIAEAFELFRASFGDPDFDLERAAERIWHEDCELVPRYARLEGRSFRGPRGAVEFIEEARRLFDYFEPELEELIGEGDVRVAIYRIQARMNGSDIDLQQRLGAHMEVRDGKVSLMRVFADPRDALHAAGLDQPA